MIVFYYSEESQLNLIKKVFGYKTKLWEYSIERTNIEEQLRFVNSDKQIYFDKSIHEHLTKNVFNKPKISD
jgi:hypothetical protein